MKITLPENFKIVEALVPKAASGTGTGDYICCKNAHKVWVVIQHYGGGGDNDITLGLYEATDVAAGTKAAITETFPIWTNLDTATADTFTRQTDAATYTIDTGLTDNAIVIFEWDPAKFSDGYDCLAVYATDEGHASNIISALYFIEERYKSDSPPAAITD